VLHRKAIGSVTKRPHQVILNPKEETTNADPCDFRLMYAFFQKKGMKAAPSDLERSMQLLGHAPRNFEGFAEETARMWGK